METRRKRVMRIVPKVVFSTVFVGVVPVVACGDDDKSSGPVYSVANCMTPPTCGGSSSSGTGSSGFSVADAGFRHDADAEAGDSGDGADGDLDGSDADVGTG